MGKPSASQRSKPPSRILEFVCPNAWNIKSARGDENTPCESYLPPRPAVILKSSQCPLESIHNNVRISFNAKVLYRLRLRVRRTVMHAVQGAYHKHARIYAPGASCVLTQVHASWRPRPKRGSVHQELVWRETLSVGHEGSLALPSWHRGSRFCWAVNETTNH
jgi:hypothetical protein